MPYRYEWQKIREQPPTLHWDADNRFENKLRVLPPPPRTYLQTWVGNASPSVLVAELWYSFYMFENV